MGQHTVEVQIPGVFNLFLVFYMPLCKPNVWK